MLSVGVTANRSRERVPGYEETAAGRGLPGHGASDHTEEDEAERAGAATAHAVSFLTPEPELRG